MGQVPQTVDQGYSLLTPSPAVFLSRRSPSTASDLCDGGSKLRITTSSRWFCSPSVSLSLTHPPALVWLSRTSAAPQRVKVWTGDDGWRGVPSCIGEPVGTSSVTAAAAGRASTRRGALSPRDTTRAVDTRIGVVSKSEADNSGVTVSCGDVVVRFAAGSSVGKCILGNGKDAVSSTTVSRGDVMAPAGENDSRGSLRL